MQSKELYKHELIMGFYLATHLEKPIVKFLYNEDDWLKETVQNVVEKFFNLNDEDKVSVLEDDHSSPKKGKSIAEEEKNQSVLSLYTARKDKYFDFTKLLDFSSSNKINIKTILRSKAGENLTTNWLKIALINQEEILASVLLTDYYVQPEINMLKRALTTQMFQFIHYMWMFEKNYFLDSNNEIKKWTYKELFDLIKKICDDKAVTRIKEVADWRLNTKDENLVLALLQCNIDSVACANAKFYPFDNNEELFLFAIDNENEVYLKYALQESILKEYVDNESMIKKVLECIEKGIKIELCLNILLYANFSKWKLDLHKRLVGNINRIITENDENNYILLTSNTLMALAHCCEFLHIIGNTVKLFKRRTSYISQRLELLIEKMIDYTENDLIEKIFLDRDFKDRTLLKIVTEYQFNAFLKSSKITILMDSIWRGMYAIECDGRLDDFSSMTFLLKSKTTSIKGRKIGLKDLLTNKFNINIEVMKFWFQYTFRRESVEYIFVKDFLCAIGLVIIFQYINFQYLELFRLTVYDDLPTRQAKLDKIEENLSTYNNFNFIGTICAFSLVYSVIWKVVFNYASKENIPYDKWTIMDAFWGIVCLVCFNYTGRLSAESILDQSRKQNIDYYVVAVVVLSWLRFFAYFLVIKPVSKLLMTLIKMLRDTMSFMFIMSWYLLIASSIFTTLFQGPAPEFYHSLPLSLRTCFDYMLGNYERENISRNNYSHSVLLITHVIVSNIFLMNYLIAILATVYSSMRVVGDFKYKANRYSYIEKFQIAYLDTKGYEEYVIHPAPINLLTLALIPFTLQQKGNKFSDIFSKCMFWLENLVMIVIFFCYLVILIPIIYFKMLFHLFKSTRWFNFLWVGSLWMVFGILLLPFYVWKDVFYFIKINWDYGEVESGDNQIANKSKKEDKLLLYNELYDVMKSIFVEMKRGKRSRINKIRHKMFQSKKKANVVQEWVEEDNKYSIDKKMVIKAWKRYKTKAKDDESSADEDNNMAIELKSNAIPANKKFRQYVGKKIVKAIIKSVSRTKNDEDFEDLENTSNTGIESKNILDTDSNQGDADDEKHFVDAFLSRFLLSSDSNTKGEINLYHALRALPKRLNEVNFNRIEMMNLSVIQMSIIAFQNDDKDELFNFYDKRNKTRLHKLKLTSVDNNKSLEDILKRLIRTLEKSSKLFGTRANLKHRADSTDTFVDNDKSDSASGF